jgi:hypothetical protein
LSGFEYIPMCGRQIVLWARSTANFLVSVFSAAPNKITIFVNLGFFLAL